MKNILSEGEVKEINRIREIMMIKESKVERLNFINETRIGSMLAQELVGKIKNALRGLRSSGDFTRLTDQEWNYMLNALENDSISVLPNRYQTTLSKLIKLKFADLIPKIHENILKVYYEKYPGESYRDFINLLSVGSKSEGKSIEEILKTGGKNGGAVFLNKNGNPDYFAIDLISPRLEKDVDNFRNKKDLEFSVESLPKPPKSERVANWLDTKVGKYKTARAFYEGMLRAEPGSKYFFQLVTQNSKNIVRKLRKKELFDGLTSEQKTIAMDWFKWGVADWNMVQRYSRQLGWPYIVPNVAGQVFRKWLVLSGIMSAYSIGKALINAAPKTAEKMEVPEALYKRVFSELVAASPGLTSPFFRVVDIFLFTFLLPSIRGRSEYKEEWDKYFDGELSRVNALLNRTERGENVEDDEQLNQVLKNPETPDTKVKGVPMPNPQKDSLKFDSTSTGAVKDSTASNNWWDDK
jgi:hypothetical protein